MTLSATLRAQAMNLDTADKLQLIDDLLSSITPTSQTAEKAWQQEVDQRLNAYDQGTLKAKALKKVLGKYAV